MFGEQNHEGWKNYETWAMALWIDNNESYLDEVLDMAREASKEPRDQRFILADDLKKWVEDRAPELETFDVYADLLNAAMSEIDYWELAEHYLGQLDEREATE